MLARYGPVEITTYAIWAGTLLLLGAFLDSGFVDLGGLERALEERFRAWRSVLAKGVLPLCADDLPWEEAVAEAGGPERGGVGEAARDTACRFCRFTTLCRARVGEERP